MIAVVALVALLGQTPANVTGATIAGTIFDEQSGAPIAGARVSLTTPRPIDGIRARLRPTTTDDEGRFVFAAVPPGHYNLTASAPRFGSRTGGPKAPALNVVGSERIDGLELSLRRAGSIAGRVVGPDGRPAAGISVTAIRKLKDGLVTPGSGRPVPTAGMAMSDGDGRFVFESLPAWEYYLRARGGPRYSAPPSDNGVTPTTDTVYYPGTTSPDSAVAVTVVDGVVTTVGDLRLVEALAFDISGSVVDEAGRAIADVRLRLVPQESPRQPLPIAGVLARTDDHGTFTMRTLPGRYLLVAVPPLVVPTTPETATRQGESMGFSLGGNRADTTRGYVWVESQDGVTRQFRDEWAALVPLTVSSDPVSGIVIVARRP